MKIAIFYFSGTGNTKKLLNLYREYFENGGNETEIVEITSATLKSYELESFDLVGIGYPIHAFNAPQIVQEFVKRLIAPQQKKRAFIFKTSGEPVKMSDASSLKLIKMLRRRNVEVTNEYQYVMPYNIIFRHSDEAAYKMWSIAQKTAPLDCAEILSGKENKRSRVFAGGLTAWFLRIEHPGARLIGRFFKTTKACVNCGLCIKNCPAENIKLNKKGKIKFGGKCLICMRCVFNCPKDAIKPGLLNGWKVNGAYSFEKPEEKEKPAPVTKEQKRAEKKDRKHANYCKKAYDRYYKYQEQKIADATKAEI